MRIKKAFVLLPAVLLLAAACGRPAVNQNSAANQAGDNMAQSQSQNQTNSQGQSQTVTMVKVTLDPQNNSGQSGMATITEVQGKARVILSMTGKPSSVAQPAHVHFGSCAAIGDVKYPLTSVTAGASQADLSVSLQQLIAEPFAINVHKSAAESNIYVACGDSLKMNKS